MRLNVVMECGHSPFPGEDWFVRVSFVGNAKTYRVWTKSNEDRTRVLLRQASGPLTWRRIVADIEELDEVGLAGDFLGDIAVHGVPDWQASLLKMAWCKYEGPASRQLEFLLALPDHTIANLQEKLGELTDPDVLEALDEVSELMSTSRIAMTKAFLAVAACDDALQLGLARWMQEMSRWCKAHESTHDEPGMTMAEAIQEHSLQDFLSMVSKPAPDCPEVARILLMRWASAKPKPIHESKVGGIAFESTLPFLQWLMQRLDPGALSAIGPDAPEAVVNAIHMLSAHIESEINRLRTFSGGGALGRGVSRSMVFRWQALQQQAFGSALRPAASVCDGSTESLQAPRCQ